MNKEDVMRDISDRFEAFSSSMNERQRRHWAADEALKLGRGGITLVSKALRISPNTIKKGMMEIASGQSSEYADAENRIRKKGGGRKPKT